MKHTSTLIEVIENLLDHSTCKPDEADQENCPGCEIRGEARTAVSKAKEEAR